MSGTMIRFVRYTCQGIAIACLGTIGVSHSWEAFIGGIVMLFAAMGFLYCERKANLQ